MPGAVDAVIVKNVICALTRYLAPALSALILLRCALPLLSFRREPEVWGWLIRSDGTRCALKHWENVIGRDSHSDIVLDQSDVARSHCVLTRYDDGSWTVSNASRRGGVAINGQAVLMQELHAGDTLTIGQTQLTFEPIAPEQARVLFSRRPRGSGVAQSMIGLLLLTLLQMLAFLNFTIGSQQSAAEPYLLGFGALAVSQWALFVFYLLIRRPAFEVETIAFFLCTIGMAVICSVDPQEVGKQLIAMLLGLLTFLLVGWSLRDLERAKVIRYLAAVGGVALLAITLLFGTEYHGAKNWLVFGGHSFQPSELAKVCFVYVGASTLDRLMDRRNLILFITYTLMLCGLLALMNDFGTALIFFFAFLLIAYMRSGSVGTVALACTALGFAGVIGVKLAPHALRRFSTWRHIWEDPFGAGYQQTRALICIASGGLFGLGIGNGRMKHIFAADSDMVFATICEEWGLIMGIVCILAVIVLALFSVRCSFVTRSSMYAIASCTAAGILVVQTIFNALGTVDILPLTGVNFPFVSNGGSGMMGAWGLLAFIKAADTRRKGSFAVRPIRFRREEHE